MTEEGRKPDPRVQKLIATLVLGGAGLGVGYLMGEVRLPLIREDVEASEGGAVRKIHRKKVRRRVVREIPAEEMTTGGIPDRVWADMTPSRLREILGRNARNVKNPRELLRYLTEEERECWRYYVVRKGNLTSFDRDFVVNDAKHLVAAGNGTKALAACVALYEENLIDFQTLYNEYGAVLRRMGSN